MKVKLHFNRINMKRKLSTVWSAHTYQDCNGSEEVLIVHNGKVIGRTVYNPDGKQPRAYVEFYGDVKRIGTKSQIEIG